MAGIAYLVLQKGSVYEGIGFGSVAPLVSQLIPGKSSFSANGEIVFNTAMSGYYEVLTDPSYTGQIVAMTYPHIGNYGTDIDWNESGPETGRTSRPIKAAGFVVRSVYTGPVPEGRGTLDSFLKNHNIPGISEVDTRRLTLELRDGGSQKAVIVSPDDEKTGLTATEKERALLFLASVPEMEGANLIGDVGTAEKIKIDACAPVDADAIGHHSKLAVRDADKQGIPHGLRVALYDCGAKANIIRELESFGCEVVIHPSDTTAGKILADKPDGILISNGPGDPAVLNHQIEVIRDLFGKTTVTGICLGHQLMSIALGARTYKMKFGHHGINHPVRDEITKKVFVTSQNHGFAVDEASLPPDVQVWFRNANDHTVEGLISKERRIYSAQFHPESAPGPYDSLWIFGAFLRAMSV